MASCTYAPRSLKKSNCGNRHSQHNRTPTCAYCKESGHWMKDRRENRVLCPKLIQKNNRAAAARTERKKENQLIKKALESGEWLTYDRGAPYKPTKQEVRQAAGLVEDKRKPQTYDQNYFNALDSDSSSGEEEDEEQVPEPQRIVIHSAHGKKNQEPLVAPTRKLAAIRAEIVRVQACIAETEEEVSQRKAAKGTYWAEMCELDDLEQELEALQNEAASIN